VGQTAQFTLTATLSTGATQDVTAQATWQSSNAAVVTVSSSGMVAGVGFGEADVTAAYSGSRASLHVKLAPRAFTLSGVISDAQTGTPIDAEVEVIDGENAGMKTHADGNGFYSLAGLVSGSFTIRGRATAYDSRDYRVTITSADTRIDVALQHTPPSFAGVWTGQYRIADCTNIDPPGTSYNLCGKIARLQVYRFTLSQSGRTVTGSYKLVTAMFSCPCGGDYGTFDMSGTVAADDSLRLTISAGGYARGSGVQVNEQFNLRMDASSTLTGALTGTLSFGGVQLLGTFSGTILSGSR
jgi:Carboxypeptidase regulatory-like domain